ncbi:MAG: NADH-quinone oxidoreductase subunit J [SAR324 cluster bacterium]|nr:NADH-quinone oxidoreductase subunit J [SAR324 cluster bacterium]
MEVFFYLFAVLATVGAVSVLLIRSPVYCALALVGTFFCLAAIYVLLSSEFVAAVQLLVYAGAIMVLFLFVIMLLNLKSDQPFALKFSIPKIIGLAVTVGILAQLIGVLNSPAAKVGPSGEYTIERVSAEGATEVVGRLLFTEYVLPFEIISILLLVAVIGAVVLAKRYVASGEEESG